MNKKITIIGIGNMGNAIAHALIDQNVIIGKDLTLANPSFKEEFTFGNTDVKLMTSNKQAIEDSDIIILAVKPQSLQSVFSEIKNSLSLNQLIISIAAGVSMQTLKKMSGNIEQPIIRSMPNLCLQVGESMTAWVKSSEVTASQEIYAIEIFKSFGKHIMLTKEEQLNAITAISGSGVAYFLYITELLEKAGEDFGLPTDIASSIARSDSVETLRQNVTSKGGTTEASFDVFKKDNLQKVFIDGVMAANKRADELNK